MASSYFTESEAPRDFRVSSTESDGHYTKCLLCYTVKRNFYCTECIRTGNFIHSSMPYSDRYSEKQAKLLRLQANRKYILDRCEKLLLPKLKKDTIVTEAKQSRDRLDLLRLAIEQRRSNIEEKRKELNELKNYNNELRLKLPRYQKRVSSLARHSRAQREEAAARAGRSASRAAALAALRRARLRHLAAYIFPIYITYDTSDSIEDMEFIGSDTEEEMPSRARLHIVAPWLYIDGELHVGGGGGGGAGAEEGEACARAALALAAQLLAIIAWHLDQRLPHPLHLQEYSSWEANGSEAGVRARAERVCACAAGVCAPQWAALAAAAHTPADLLHPLAALHALALAAATDHPALARVNPGLEGEACEWAARWGSAPHDDAEPEHLSWPDNAQQEVSTSPPAAAAAPPATPPASASLVTSAAASLASMWRGWTK